MSAVELPLRYTLDSAPAIAGADALATSLLNLEVIVDRVGAKLKALATGVGQPLGAASKAVDKLATSLEKVERTSKTAHAGLGSVVGVSKAAATALDTTAAAAKGASTGMGGTSRSAGRLTQRLANMNTAAVTASNGLSNAAASAIHLGSAFNISAGHSRGLSGGLGRIAGAGAGIAVVKAAMDALADALERARDFARETAEENIKLRDSVRELRALKGDGVTTEQTATEVKELMRATGAKQADAVAFDAAFESDVFAAKQSGHWKLNDQETGDLKTKVLQFAMSNGVDPRILGKAIANIGAHEDISSVEQATAKLGVVHQMMNEGSGEAGPLYTVANKLRGVMVRPAGGSATRSEEELAAIISGMSVDAGNVPATTRMVNQVWRELSSANNEDKKATFAKYGIQTGDDFITRVEKIKPLIDEAEKPGGPGALQAMLDAGFRNSDANMKVIDAAQNLKIIKDRVARTAPAPGQDRKQFLAANAKKVDDSIDRFYKENPQVKAEAATALARQERGEEGRNYEILQKYVEAGMVKRHALDTKGSNLAENIMDMKDPFFGKSIMQGIGETPARQKFKDMVLSQIIGKAVPNAKQRFPDLDGNMRVFGTPARENRLRDIVNQLTPAEREEVFKRAETFALDSQQQKPAGAAKPAAAAAAAVPVQRRGPAAPMPAPQLNAKPQPGPPGGANAGAKPAGVIKAQVDMGTTNGILGQILAAVKDGRGSTGGIPLPENLYGPGSNYRA